MELITATANENLVLGGLDSKIFEINEMSIYEREFLNALILRHQPKKFWK